MAYTPSVLQELFLAAIIFSYTQNVIGLNYNPQLSQTKISEEEQQKTAQEFINRISGTRDEFEVTVNFTLFQNNKDCFHLLSIRDDRIEIRASTGAAALWGFNYYLKKYLKGHIGWQVKNLQMLQRGYRSKLPRVDEKVVANDKFRYYQNVCTVSYSFIWWGETEWYEHIAWMAMNGINIALAPHAQEAIWLRLYRRYNMTDLEIDEHFTGPAFLSWLRMGNLRAWGGPLTKNWHDRTMRLQHWIVDKMNKLGMIPILPAFAGHVPTAFSRLFPNVKFHKLSEWSNFNGDLCCPLLIDPAEDLFRKVGVDFLKEMTEEFGVYHFYNADPFNEIVAPNMSVEFVQQVSRTIFTTMNAVDEKSVWILQNWMLVNDPGVWSIPLTKAFLESIPKGKLLILDLQSEQLPQFELHKMYYGHGFIWCMLHNFGGTMGLFGSMPKVNQNVHDARKAEGSTMMGIGLTMEGINQNYVVYDLMLENAWRKEPHPNLEDWVAEYALRRYGTNTTSKAWSYLLKSVYDYRGSLRMHGKYVLTREPRRNIDVWAWYTNKDLTEAWKNFLLGAPQNPSDAYLHDLVDITRQVLQYRLDQYYVAIMESNRGERRVYVNQFLEIMDDLSEILGSHGNFRADKWVNGAAAAAEGHPGLAKQYEMNAKNQIMLWGPNGEINDYACKQWYELVKYYYKIRWELYLNGPMTNTVIRQIAAKEFYKTTIESGNFHEDPWFSASMMFKKWAYVPMLKDLRVVNDEMSLHGKRGDGRSGWNSYSDDYNTAPSVEITTH